MGLEMFAVFIVDIFVGGLKDWLVWTPYKTQEKKSKLTQNMDFWLILQRPHKKLGH